MARALSNAATAAMTVPVGLEPVTIVSISWGAVVTPTGQIVDYYGNVVNYADKDITDPEHPDVVIVPGKITAMSDLDAIVKIDTGSDSANLTVTLSDTDGTIKSLFDQFDLHKRPVIVYQHFMGLDPTIHPFKVDPIVRDPFEIFRGEIASPVVWSEGERTLTFDIISKIYALEAGFAPEQGQFSYVPIQLVGKVWPMCFGTPIHVPATKFQQVVSGTILTTFGVPDATLYYKLNMLEYVKNDLANSYNYYNRLITVAQEIEDPAYQIQEEFAHHIVSHDGMKQTVEDMHDTIEEINKKMISLIAEYNDNDPDAADRADLLTELTPLRDERTALLKQYKTMVQQSHNMKLEAEGYKLRLKNVKFEISAVNKLRKKVRAVLGDYYKAVKQIGQLNNAIKNQKTLQSNATSIMVGPDFPQLKSTLFNINGLTIAGIVSGYNMLGIVPQPAYTNIQIGPRGGDEQDPELAADLTAFWLADNQPNMTPSNEIPSLLGMYLYLGGLPPDSSTTPPKIDHMDGRIALVTQQNGRMVNIQLVQKQRNPRIKKQQIDYLGDPTIKESFEETLERLLTGNETEEQINAIANNIPKDISPKIWNILQGGDNVIYVELINTTTYIDPKMVVAPNIDLDQSSFRLLYNNVELTDKIYFTDNAQEIEKKILTSTLSIDDNDITVTIDKTWASGSKSVFWRTIKIQYNGLMRPLTVSQPDIVNNTKLNRGQLNIRKQTTEPTGCFIRYTRDTLKPNFSLLMVGDYISKDPKTGILFDEDKSVTDQTSYASPKIAVYFRGYKIEFNPTDTKSDDLQALIEAIDPIFVGAVTVESVDPNNKDQVRGATSLLFADWKITFNTEYTSIFLDTNHVQFRTYNPDETILEFMGFKKPVARSLKSKFKMPALTMETFGGGAHEFTNNQRQTKLQNLVAKNANAPGITKYRNAIQAILKEMGVDDVGAAAQQGGAEALFNAMSAYRTMAKTVDQSVFNNDEAYKLISDNEYQLLYDLEVTGYTEWVNAFQELDNEFTENIDYEYTALDIVYIKEAASTILPRWLQRLQLDPMMSDNDRIKAGKLTTTDVLYETYLLPNNTTAWSANVGDTITLAGNFQESYVCSIIPGLIKAVYAKKSVNGLNVLVPIPSRFYLKQDMSLIDKRPDGNTYSNCHQVHDQKSYADFGLYHGVSLTFVQPLTNIDPSWSDEVFVTLESCVGPNICDVIAWLVATYTNVTLDLVSFQEVHGLQINYPVNFALLTKINIIQLCEDLAWQARCTLWIKENVMYIRYLPLIPDSVRVITKDDIQQASLELSYTTTEDLITKLTGTWKSTYAQTDPYTMILRRNLTRYNEVADSRDMYIYNSRDLVWKTLTFWIMRRGSTWKLVKCKLFMNNINLETQDCVTFDFGPDSMISSGPINGILTKATFNSNDFSIDIEAWLPILAGELTQFKYAWPANVQEFWPLPTDLVGGNAGSFNVVNGGTVTAGLGGGELTLPIDVGNPKIGDTNDALPDDPSSAFTEVDYEQFFDKPVDVDANLNADLDNDGIQHAVPDGPGDGWVSDDPDEIPAMSPTGWDQGIVVGVDQETDPVTGDVTYPTYDIKPSDGRTTYTNCQPLGFNISNQIPINTPVEFRIFNGRIQFRILNMVQPEVTNDPQGNDLLNGPPNLDAFL